MIWAEARSADQDGGAIGPRTGVIGSQGKMPWYLPEDLAFFRKQTQGFPVIMGRRTWESLEARFRPLPGRVNIVVTRDLDYEAPGATVVGSVEDAIEAAGRFNQERIWIMGGGQVYRAAMPFADDLVVTKIDHEYSNADTFAPEIGDEWILDDPGTYSVSKTNLGYRFERYLRA
ncbi:dihydrofolate reductase [Leucobacter sp. OLJS4]|nr:dihydrofolate reductase [Leucobacter sp. OLCALW19]PII87667.1 dihydrofolate reductase [Leucobacter sp. OLTLW20]PII90402.1 dihydrofolate reductase [Leucobacter sp. OLAS13]PII97436.1 dihydrofolate reductase [Leucobacter sp. OLDS2]PIJ01078.1 dihydrofolate reductase [Leucobacter sp. OLCS4]PIJ01868.1 dihydrofolate reductase [Leucobacter sp. OLIS6]PIJ12474.1 dihydrofolate reductase [Leucobacter sp. OLJS4]PIJ57690.1 dihydrofolate reductase [Leucobacter sp. OAMSW11]PIO49329.1 dihydrofolate reduct